VSKSSKHSSAAVGLTTSMRIHFDHKMITIRRCEHEIFLKTGIFCMNDRIDELSHIVCIVLLAKE